MLIADSLNVSLDYLVSPDSNLMRDSSSITARLIPTFSWDDLNKNSNIKKINLKTWKYWQHIKLDKNEALSTYAFALQSKPFLEPIFPRGTIFIIDPEASLLDGDIILVKINGQITLKKFSVDAPNQYLKSITLTSDMTIYNKLHHKIIGINMLTILYNRKLEPTWIEQQNQ